MSGQVSVIIPYYNGGEYIQEALQSVEAQTYDNTEIIIVDDASRKPASAVIDPFQRRMKTDIRVFTHDENRGISATRNTGISHSNGEYITILDQDDVFLPKKIEMQVTEMEQRPNLGMTLTNVFHIDHEGHQIERRELLSGIEGQDTVDLVDDLFRCWRASGGPLPLTTEMTRKSAYDTVGTYDTSLYGANDREFFFRVAKEFDVAVIDEPLLKKRYHESNASRRDLKLIEDRIKLTADAVTYHPRLRAHEHKRRAFLHLLGVRKHFLSGNFRESLRWYWCALQDAPLFTSRRTVSFPLKYVRNEM